MNTEFIVLQFMTGQDGTVTFKRISLLLKTYEDAENYIAGLQIPGWFQIHKLYTKP